MNTATAPWKLAAWLPIVTLVLFWAHARELYTRQMDQDLQSSAYQHVTKKMGLINARLTWHAHNESECPSGAACYWYSGYGPDGMLIEGIVWSKNEGHS
jgi:hypothetical protein